MKTHQNRNTEHSEIRSHFRVNITVYKLMLLKIIAKLVNDMLVSVLLSLRAYVWIQFTFICMRPDVISTC